MNHPGRKEILRLYRSLLSESSKLQGYNFKMYSLRRVRQGFRELQHSKDAKAINDAFNEGKNMADLIKRQAIISNLYPEGQTVMQI